MTEDPQAYAAETDEPRPARPAPPQVVIIREEKQGMSAYALFAIVFACVTAVAIVSMIIGNSVP